MLTQANFPEVQPSELYEEASLILILTDRLQICLSSRLLEHAFGVSLKHPIALNPHQLLVVSQKPGNGKVSRTKLSSQPSDVYSCSIQVAAFLA